MSVFPFRLKGEPTQIGVLLVGVAVGLGFTTIVISSTVIVFAQGPLLTVQANTLGPMLRPLTVAFGEVALVIVPVPLTSVHTPVAGKIKLLPASVVPVLGVHSSWSGPALATGLV